MWIIAARFFFYGLHVFCWMTCHGLRVQPITGQHNSENTVSFLFFQLFPNSVIVSQKNKKTVTNINFSPPEKLWKKCFNGDPKAHFGDADRVVAFREVEFSHKVKRVKCRNKIRGREKSGFWKKLISFYLFAKFQHRKQKS